MSTSYTAMLIYGWKVDFQEIYDDVTKYDVDTGKPYLVSVLTRKEAWIGDVRVIEDVNNADIDDIVEYGDPDFEVHQVFDGVYLGYSVSVGRGNSYRPIDMDEIKFPERLKEWAKTYGTPKQYFGLDIS